MFVFSKLNNEQRLNKESEQFLAQWTHDQLRMKMASLGHCTKDVDLPHAHNCSSTYRTLAYSANKANTARH